MNPFSYHDLPVSRWRNGGGETREIISFPPGEVHFGWRASIATISTDGAFSLFPGVDRVITLLQGDAVRLNAPGTEQRLTLHQPWAFPGELALKATLTGGTSLDFNIMTRRASWLAAVQVLSTAVSSEHGVAFVLSGEWRLAHGKILAPQQGIWWVDEPVQLTPLSQEAHLLFTRLSRVP
ncbi:HutD family protein [Pantoea sp. LMR881]|uniref:HutD/Ves family protein n=1 Tax=Pantoea sp. LMR881 TaxID=3014336 RepID=UPI0022AEDA90|nr:HutD family protein [Pantoea sp. LMR881]MCZ4058881.1 HutD family protein [Pantoea sp. LMR881]